MLLGFNELVAEQSNDLEHSVLTDDEIEEVADSLDEEQQVEVIDTVAQIANTHYADEERIVATTDLTQRAAFSIRAHQIKDAGVRKDIATGHLRPLNMSFYNIIDVSGKQNYELMHNTESKSQGETNLNSRKLDKNNHFLLTSIILQSGTFTTNPNDADFGVPNDTILNGEFSLLNASTVIIPPSSCKVFDTNTNGTNNKDGLMYGEWRLDNPKWLRPEIDIIPEIKLAGTLADKTAIKIILVGVGLMV
jgi:hypothetical protein